MSISSRIFCLLSVPLSLTLLGCTINGTNAPTEITQEVVDAHRLDTQWLLNSVKTQEMEISDSERCGLYLMMHYCQPGLTLREVSLRTNATYWLSGHPFPELYPPANLDHLPAVNSVFIYYFSFWTGDRKSGYPFWLGCSEKSSPAQIIFALTHPDSGIAGQLRVTGVYFENAPQITIVPLHNQVQ